MQYILQEDVTIGGMVIHLKGAIKCNIEFATMATTGDASKEDFGDFFKHRLGEWINTIYKLVVNHGEILAMMITNMIDSVGLHQQENNILVIYIIVVDMLLGLL